MQNPNNEPSVRLRMCNVTHHHHVNLNQHPLLLGLIKPHSSLVNYHKILCAYFEIYQLLENRINLFLKATPCLFDYAERIKLPWLIQDLEFFQLYFTAQRSLTDKVTTLPEITSIGHLVGVLYVLEGATLGGQFISGCLFKNHGLHSTQGARFFTGYGERSSLMWQSFVEFSESINNNEVQCDAAVVAASHTFKFFIQILDDHVHRELQFRHIHTS
ncbi:MAG: biliverdin-producing heme oxygenase [Methylotenera sp.]|nr:biliverdin-producing heme oxygenase [Methylotenera sp.]